MSSEGTAWVEEGPQDYECVLTIEGLPGSESVSIPVVLSGDGLASDQYAEICRRMQVGVQSAVSDGLGEVGLHLDQLVGVGHYATGGISRQAWRSLSQDIATESFEHVNNFLRLRIEAAIAEAMSWAVLRFEVLPTHADVIGSWIRHDAGLEKLQRTRSARRKAMAREALDWVSIIGDAIRRLLPVMSG